MPQDWDVKERDCDSEISAPTSSTSSSSRTSSGLVLPHPNPNSSSLTPSERRKLSLGLGLDTVNPTPTPVVAACTSSRSEGAGCGGGSSAGSSVNVECPPFLQIEDNNNGENHKNSSRSSISRKMLTCRVLLVLLLVKCLILSFIIPAHLIPTNGGNGNGDYPAPSPTDYEGGHGEEDGFDNNIMLDDDPNQPLPLTLKNEILNLVDTFDIPSQPVTAPNGHNGNGNNGVEEPPAPESEDNSNTLSNEVNGGGGNGNGGNTESSPEPENDEGNTDNESGDSASTNGGSENGGDDDGDGDAGETKGGEDGEEAAAESESESSAASATESEDKSGNNGNGNGGGTNGGSCSHNDDSMKNVMEKLEGLMDAVKNIDSSIDKMETLVQSTMIDERVLKCMSAIQNGNQTQALKYWKQILRYLSTPQKQAGILNQLIRDSYSGSQEHILPVIQFIEQTTLYYGYHTLFKELPKYNHLYRNTAIFTLGHHIKKSCGRNSALYTSLPSAVQSVFADFFTLQNKHNKGYLYYAKRCVAKHYFHCLDVLTKRIDPYVLDGLADDSEEKKRYHWKLNATDTTVTKFYILNHDKYWTYRLQDLNNSPRFKMEEAGSNAEVDLAHFQLKLNSDDEIMIQVRDSEDYLEEEDFKNDKSEVRLHSFHQADGIPDSPRMFWLVSPVNSGGSSEGEPDKEPDTCNLELAAVQSHNNGNGNGSSK